MFAARPMDVNRCTAAELDRTVKGQRMRLFDVFVLGPLMIYAATKLSKEHRVAAVALGFFGLTTIGYNAKNYIDVEAG